MAEEGFSFEDIGKITEENYEEKMREFEFNDDKEKKIGDQTIKITKDFIIKKEEFINNKVKEGKISEEEFKNQATKDLKTMGIVEPTEAQIESLSYSYKMEFTTKFSLQPMERKVIDDYFDLEKPQVKLLVDRIISDPKIISDPDPQKSLKSLEKAVTGISEKNPKLKLKEGFKKIGDMSIDEFKDALNKRQEKTINIEEKGICQRMKDYIKENLEKLNENKGSIALYILLTFLGYEFLNTEVIAGSGCMVKISGANSDCRALGFTIINKTDSTNECTYLDSKLCKQPAILDESKVEKCKTGYEQNPIIIDKTAVCSEFCNSTYLIETDKDKTFSYNCQKCGLECAFIRVFQVIANVADDLGSNLGGLWDFLEKWGFYIIIVIAIIIVVYLITKVIQGAREIKHVLYDTETGSTTTISSHDELSTLLANKVITLKPSRFRSKK